VQAAEEAAEAELRETSKYVDSLIEKVGRGTARARHIACAGPAYALFGQFHHIQPSPFNAEQSVLLVCALFICACTIVVAGPSCAPSVMSMMPDKYESLFTFCPISLLLTR